ncbi:MAG: DUF2318 domain-containing protein [Desulfobacterales bacterium]|nr:DUF2318 domain-containing protein [Desulfobacterales bacterium]MCP4159489.1 DUF2318 domain-containing protein [Deltaproteobacteria bacterium]
MKKIIAISIILLLSATTGYSFFGSKYKTLKPKNGNVSISLSTINNGDAHYFQVKSVNNIDMKFFVLKSSDGVYRAAVDACDVCYRSGKGYAKSGDYMVCNNCGMKFLSTRINVVKGGCNPAPLNRTNDGKNLIIKMSDINSNDWYCKFM